MLGIMLSGSDLKDRPSSCCATRNRRPTPSIPRLELTAEQAMIARSRKFEMTPLLHPPTICRCIDDVGD